MFLSSVIFGGDPSLAVAPLTPSPPPAPPVSGCGQSLVVVAGGGRDLAWSPLRIASELKAHSQGRLVQRLFQGGARGADRAIDAAAHRLGWLVEVIPADWRRYGRGAGPIRNRQLLSRACEQASAHPLLAPAGVLVIAFPGHSGTASLIAQAEHLKDRSPLSIELVRIQP